MPTRSAETSGSPFMGTSCSGTLWGAPLPCAPAMPDRPRNCWRFRRKADGSWRNRVSQCHSENTLTVNHPEPPPRTPEEVGVPSKVLLQKNNRTGRFRFSLLSARGQVIVASEPYESKRGAMAALNAFRKNAADAVLVDETEPRQPAPAKKTAARAANTTSTRAAAAAQGNGRRTTRRATTGAESAAAAPAKTT